MRITTLLFPLLLLLSFQSMAQQQAVRIEDSGWRLGLNIGGAYQGAPFGELDGIDPGFGMGFGFTVGHMLYQRPGDLLNLGMRGRFLWETTSGTSTEPHYAIGEGQSWKDRYDLDLVGQNYQDEPGYVYPNYRQEGRQYDLELTLGLNRLAERTNLYLYLFGGVGVINYNIHTDQLDENGDPYDYGGLSGSPSQDQLEELWDGDYETMIYEGGKVNRFIPSGGLGLLYQINPSLGIGFEHKVSFPHKEDLFDAKEYRNAGPNASFGDLEKTASSDIYHYTALTFRWRLISRGTKDDDKEQDQAGTQDPSPSGGQTTEPRPTPPPKVNILDPSDTPHRTRSELYPLRAKIEEVDKREDLALWVNGDRVGDFRFDPRSGILEKELNLVGGGNQVMVQAVNEGGKDKDRALIVHLEERPDPPAPKVKIVDPQRDPVTHFNPTRELKADVLNVDSKSELRFHFNGSSHPFQFDPNSGTLSADLQLIEGANSVRIEAENEGGKASDDRTMILKKQAKIDPPRVSIDHPSSDPAVVTDPGQGVLQASVENVSSRSQLTVTHNGKVVHNYQFYPNSDLLTMNRTLESGNNLFLIKAKNEGGSDQAEQRIILEKEKKDAPQVDITVPASKGKGVSSSPYTIEAKVRHVSQKSQVKLEVNGKIKMGFQFDPASSLLRYDAPLKKGTNHIKVSASNSEGADMDATSLVYKVKKGTPPSVSFHTPSKKVSKSSSKKAVLKAHVSNVKDASQLQLLVNGSFSNDYNYDASKGEVTVQEDLIKGQNHFVLKASTPHGSDQDERRIDLDPADPPAVKITKPTSDPHSSTKKDIVIKGKVTEVDDASGLELLANGNKVTSFQFVSGLFKYQMSLSKGKNKFKVIASNASGQASDEVEIHYVTPKKPKTGGTKQDSSASASPASKQGQTGGTKKSKTKEKSPDKSGGRSPTVPESKTEENDAEKETKKKKKEKKNSSDKSEDSSSDEGDNGKKKKKKKKKKERSSGGSGESSPEDGKKKKKKK